MYYLVTVGYETERVDREGNPRIQKVKYPVEAESTEEAVLVMNKYCAEGVATFEILATAKMTIECIIDHKHTPDYYDKSF